MASIIAYKHTYPSSSVTFAAAAAVGDVIIVIGTGVDHFHTSCVDDLGNVYRRVSDTGNDSDTGHRSVVEIWCALVCKPGTPTVTLSGGGGGDFGTDGWIVRGERMRVHQSGSAVGAGTPLTGGSLTTTRRCSFFGAWSEEISTNDFLNFVALDGSVTTDNHDSGHYSAAGHRLAVAAGTYSPGADFTAGATHHAVAYVFLEELLDGDPYLIDYADSGAVQTAFPMDLSMTVDAAQRRLVLVASLSGTSIDSATWNTSENLSSITGTPQNNSGFRTTIFDLVNPGTGAHTLRCNVTGGSKGWVAGYLIGTYGSGYNAPTQDVGDGTTASSATSISKATTLAQANELSIDVWVSGNSGANPVPDSPQANGRKSTSPSFFEAATSMAHIAASGSNTDGWTNDSSTSLALGVAYFKGGTSGGGTVSASISDGAKGGDSWAVTVTRPATVSDGAKAGDAEASRADRPAAITDGAAVGDTQAAAVSHLISGAITEGAKAGDAEAGISTRAAAVAEGAKAGDAASPRADRVAAASEGAITGEAWAAGATASRAIAEGAAAGDAEAGAVFHLVAAAIVEGAKAGDSYGRRGDWSGSWTEGAKAGDTPAARTDRIAALAEGLKAGDFFATGGSAIASIIGPIVAEELFELVPSEEYELAAEEL